MDIVSGGLVADENVVKATAAQEVKHPFHIDDIEDPEEEITEGPVAVDTPDPFTVAPEASYHLWSNVYLFMQA